MRIQAMRQFPIVRDTVAVAIHRWRASDVRRIAADVVLMVDDTTVPGANVIDHPPIHRVATGNGNSGTSQHSFVSIGAAFGPSDNRMTAQPAPPDRT